MKYANQVTDIINAFSPAALKKKQMAEFYCKDTMEYRTSDKYSSPIEDIFDICRSSEGYNACLLLGHKGCGKSTELNMMSGKLTDVGYHVRTVHCGSDLDLFNIVYSDLFILMGEALLEIAEEVGCDIGNKVLDDIRNFWYEGTETVIAQELEAASLETGMSVETKGVFAGLLNIFSKMKADLKYNEEIRKEYRKKNSVRSSEWIGILGNVAEEIAKKVDGKKPIIIFEDLDKLNPEDARRALEEIKTSLTRRIEEKDYAFLLNIYNENKERIEDKEMLLKMLQESVVLEYNGKRWRNVHPLVVDFFKEQGMIEDVRE